MPSPKPTAPRRAAPQIAQPAAASAPRRARRWKPATFLPRPTVRGIADALVAADLGVGETMCVLLAERDAPDLDALRRALAATGVSFCGALVPALLRGAACTQRGALLRRLPALARPLLLRDLGAPLPETLRLPRDSTRQPPTALILLDGLSPHIGPFLHRLYDRLGNRVTYFGGGAGSLTLRQRPCVFGPEGVFQDAALVALIDAASDLGACHGWKRAAGPFVATRARGTTIDELNWSPAGQTYRDAVESIAGAGVWEQRAFNEVVAAYPLGIVRRGQEDLVRDVVDVTLEDSVVCVGAVPENAILYVLHGEASDLVGAARRSVRATYSEGTQSVYGGLIADCASRLVYLQHEGYAREIAALHASFAEANVGPLEGLLTLGEIASRGDGLVELHNKTVVTSVFYERA